MESVIVGVDVHIDPLRRRTYLGRNAVDRRDAVDSVPYKGFVQIANTHVIVGRSRATTGRPYSYICAFCTIMRLSYIAVRTLLLFSANNTIM